MFCKLSFVSGVRKVKLGAGGTLECHKALSLPVRSVRRILVALAALFPATASAGPIHALDINTNVNNNTGYSVGWDFHVTGTIWVTNLGIFDPAGTANGEVAIYQDFDGGNRLAYGNVLTSSPTEMSGTVDARYVSLTTPVQLSTGDYVIYTNASETFSEHTTAVTFGPAISKGPRGGVANGGFAALSTTTPVFGIINGADYRYYGPTFEYVTSIGPSWNLSSGGDWNTNGNWTGDVYPNAADAAAVLGSSLTNNAAPVNISSTVTVGTLALSNSISYTLSAGSGQSLTLASSTGMASIQDQLGSHLITSPITLNNNATVTVNNPGDTLTISGRLNDNAADKALTVSGAGTTILSNTANVYSGGTTLSGGVLQFAATGSLGSGQVTFNGGTLQYPSGGGISPIDVSSQFAAIPSGQQAIIDTNGSTATFATAISGSGGLSKIGQGMLVLTGNHTYTGSTTVNGGTLSLTGTIGSGGGTAISVTGPGVLNQGAAAVIAGTSSLTINSGAATLSGVNTYTGNTTVSGGTLTVGHNLAVQNSTVAMSGGAIAFAAGITQPTFGGLSGNGNFNLATVAPAAVALSVGNNDANTNYGGNLSGPGSLTKVGTGILTLTASQSYGGSTIVSNGTLRLSGQSGPSGPVNLLYMGDSITSQALYVNPLRTLLANHDNTPTDLSNEGHSGYIIAQNWTYNGTAYTGTRPGLLDSISTYMNHPGVNATNSYILLMIGTNDVDTNCYLGDGNVQNRLGQLISSITGIAPQRT